MTIKLSWSLVEARARSITGLIRQFYDETPNASRFLKAYPIPSGGIYAALVVAQQAMNPQTCHLYIQLTEDPTEADIYIDDIIDSGETRARIFAAHGEKPFFALFDKQNGAPKDFYVFPWEQMNNQPRGVEDNVKRLLQFIGEDPQREGLRDTPKRVVRAWEEMFAGYKQDPSEVMTVFDDGACDEMVVLRDLEFTSWCEHHILPFSGRAHIAYIPDGQVIGISKLARMFDIYAHRLQIQERLCQQVTKALDIYLKPRGSACVIVASHSCMVCRGVKKQHSKMITSSLTGLFKQDPAARNEFMQFIK